MTATKSLQSYTEFVSSSREVMILLLFVQSFSPMILYIFVGFLFVSLACLLFIIAVRTSRLMLYYRRGWDCVSVMSMRVAAAGHHKVSKLKGSGIERQMRMCPLQQNNKGTARLFFTYTRLPLHPTYFTCTYLHLIVDVITGFDRCAVTKSMRIRSQLIEDALNVVWGQKTLKGEGEDSKKVDCYEVFLHVINGKCLAVCFAERIAKAYKLRSTNMPGLRWDDSQPESDGTSSRGDPSPMFTVVAVVRKLNSTCWTLSAAQALTELSCYTGVSTESSLENYPPRDKLCGDGGIRKKGCVLLWSICSNLCCKVHSRLVLVFSCSVVHDLGRPIDQRRLLSSPSSPIANSDVSHSFC